MKPLYILVLLSVAGMATACKVELSVKSSPTVNSTNVVVVSSNEAIATGVKIDPKDICPTNDGIVIDLDGDSINDHVILEGNIVSFSKGNANNVRGPKQLLMKVGVDNIRAYSFTYKEKFKLPVFQFWDTELNGYYMPNLGASESDGLPRFGVIEAQ